VPLSSFFLPLLLFLYSPKAHDLLRSDNDVPAVRLRRFIRAHCVGKAPRGCPPNPLLPFKSSVGKMRTESREVDWTFLKACLCFTVKPSHPGPSWPCLDNTGIFSNMLVYCSLKLFAVFLSLRSWESPGDYISLHISSFIDS